MSDAPRDRPLVIVLMGVSGAGKTTIGRRLARELGWEFVEGDDYHAPASIERMRRGTPLDDRDRGPWIEALRRRIAAALERGAGAVVACSALRREHRERLAVDPERVRFVHLVGPPALLAERLAGRRGHFLPPDLLPSQLAALEPPAGVPEVDVTPGPDRVVRAVREAAGL